MTETPAVDDLETERLAAIVPGVEIDDTRPDFLDPEPDDHEWVQVLVADLEARTGIEEPNGDVYVQDPSVLNLDSETAWVLGYRTAIHVLRQTINGAGMEVSLVSLDPEPDPEGRG